MQPKTGGCHRTFAYHVLPFQVSTVLDFPFPTNYRKKNKGSEAVHLNIWANLLANSDPHCWRLGVLDNNKREHQQSVAVRESNFHVCVCDCWLISTSRTHLNANILVDCIKKERQSVLWIYVVYRVHNYQFQHDVKPYYEASTLQSTSFNDSNSSNLLDFADTMLVSCLFVCPHDLWKQNDCYHGSQVESTTSSSTIAQARRHQSNEGRVPQNFAGNWPWYLRGQEWTHGSRSRKLQIEKKIGVYLLGAFIE